MAVTEEDIRRVELHAEHAQRAAEVLAIVRDLWEENALLRSAAETLTTQTTMLRRALGMAGQLVRSIDGIYKNPGATVQTNYEDFLTPDLRELHDRMQRGVI